MKKNKKQLFVMITLAVGVMLVCNLIGCDNGTTSKGQTAIYNGTAYNGTEYLLKVTENTSRAAYTPQSGDAYELTVTASGTTKTSKGTISAVIGEIFTLAPSNVATNAFTVMVNGQAISVIVGTITFTNNSTITAPGAFAIGADIEYTDSRGNKITIPGGAASCAVRVVSFTHGSPWTADPRAMDEFKILGAPDYDSVADVNYITLGDRGVIVLEFGVYFTDGPGNDIYVFEIGPNVEATKVEVSADLETWIFVGNADGSLSGVDLNGSIPVGGQYKYVRLTDLETNPGGNWPGADIDAVAIIHPSLMVNE